MKRTTILLFAIVIAAISHAQVTLDHTFVDTTFYDISVVELENSGKKIFIYTEEGENVGVKIYNTDNYNLFKEINISLTDLFYTQDYMFYSFDIYYIGENLFDLDNEIEFLAELYYEDNDEELYSHVLIYNADGTLLFSTDIDNNNSFLVFPSFNGYNYPGSIYNTPDGTKLIIDLYDFTDNTWKYEIYNLEGTLSAENAHNNYRNLRQAHSLKASPNPANTYVNVEYKLNEGEDNAELYIYNSQGMIVKKLDVLSNEGKIHITTSDMPSGSYIYEMKTKKRGYGRRKVILSR